MLTVTEWKSYWKDEKCAEVTVRKEGEQIL
jgi:hypothetical protein